VEFRSPARRLPWRRVEGALDYAAVARTSSRPSRIFGGNGCEDDTGVIRSAQSIRRSEASASRKLGVAFFGYHGRGIQLTAVPTVGKRTARGHTVAAVRSQLRSDSRVQQRRWAH
jgi:hypothetical protein